MVCQVEIPEAESRYKENKLFNIVPIFKLGIKETSNAIKGYMTIPIENFNGAKVEKGNILGAAQRAAKIILFETKFSDNESFPIGLVSKQNITENVNLNLNFTPYFSKGLPDSDVWDKQFSPAIACVKNALVQKKVASLRLYAFAHLSLGFLYGYVFRERTGFKLEIEQISKGKRNIWKTDAIQEEALLNMTPLDGELNSSNLCIKINLMSEDNNSFCSYVKKSGLSYRVLLEISPPNYPYIISNGQAVAIAKQLAQQIKEIHAKYGTNSVHIFAAIPLGLALLIGYNLNACGKIQCYEFDNPSREYFPSCILGNQ